ncbi:Gfo/Idh/MocA family oxidoreductase [Paenibacillus sp. TH7-28]
MTMKIGVIGCGNISPVYLTYLGQSEVARITAVADLLPEKARERAEQFAIENAYTVENCWKVESFILMER